MELVKIETPKWVEEIGAEFRPEVDKVLRNVVLDAQARQMLENTAWSFDHYFPDGEPTQPKWWQFRRIWRLASLAVLYMDTAKRWNDANKG